MNPSTEGLLDWEELMHLALKAMEADRNDDALAFLKRATALNPENGRLYYLMGAVHAEIGMIDRAIAEIGRATALAPDLGAAHFQLGLLHLTKGEFDQAQAAWRSLDELDEDDPLRVFKSGLVHLGNDEYEACIRELRRGLELSGHESLNNDMRRIIKETEAALAAQQARQAGTDSQAGRLAEGERRPKDSQHVLLAGYRQPADR